MKILSLLGVLCLLCVVLVTGLLHGCSNNAGTIAPGSITTISSELLGSSARLSLWELHHKGHEYLITGLNGAAMVHSASCPCRTNNIQSIER